MRNIGDFGRRILTLSSGTAIAQIVTLAGLPLLSRLYAPEDFGVLALFSAPTLILSAIMNLCLEKAILLPEQDRDAATLVWFCKILTLTVAVVAGLIVGALFVAGLPAVWVGAIGISVLLLPLASSGAAIFALLSSKCIRADQFRPLANATIVKAAVLLVSQLTLGLMGLGSAGLIIGFVIGQWAGNTMLASVGQSAVRPQRALREAFRLLSRYRSFPLYSVPATLANTSATHLIALLVGASMGSATLGLFSMTQRVLALPSTLISAAISNVFLRELAANRRAGRSSRRLFDRVILRASATSAVIFGSIGFLGPELFSLALGPEWREAGTYASLLAPMYFFRFIQSCIATTTIAFERQRFALGSQLFYLSAALFSFAASQFCSDRMIAFLVIFMLTGSAHSLTVTFLMRRMTKGA
ncbi:oligosaccharide flippase family protein [Dietzia maris]|uniref:Oligosaccharide flippase family protein n=1 Tax=Dietzia maris TaxID=37915 RepID=A0ABT8H4Y1_9ACTN|nr:oligosaccharide flippase family protein [Dietzia maris]MDN4507498.1 oligosaccharide flippase family protein [Dietzia maris]